jgi:hypothetical protein
LSHRDGLRYHNIAMAFPIKVCAICSEEFELKPDKPGFANHCPECTAAQAEDAATKRPSAADHLKGDKQANAARREAMRNLLYRKDS